MIDINDVAALLHVEEKLRAHGTVYKNMLAAVRAKLAQHEAAHASTPPPTPEVEDIPEGTDPAPTTRRL